MKILLLLVVVLIPSLSSAQRLPTNFTCQDLIDISNGKLSRSTDGGKTYLPINRPQPKDPFGQALLSYDTQLCYRLSRGEITVADFNALHDEKQRQLLADRQKLFSEQKALENQAAAINAQRQATIIQALQAENFRRQQEAQHQERMDQERIRQQQLEQIRQQQSQQIQQQLEQIRQQQQIQIQQQRQIQIQQPQPLRPSFSCFTSGNMIYCN